MSDDRGFSIWRWVLALVIVVALFGPAGFSASSDEDPNENDHEHDWSVPWSCPSDCLYRQ